MSLNSNLFVKLESVRRPVRVGRDLLCTLCLSLKWSAATTTGGGRRLWWRRCPTLLFILLNS